MVKEWESISKQTPAYNLSVCQIVSECEGLRYMISMQMLLAGGGRFGLGGDLCNRRSRHVARHVIKNDIVFKVKVRSRKLQPVLCSYSHCSAGTTLPQACNVPFYVSVTTA